MSVTRYTWSQRRWC